MQTLKPALLLFTVIFLITFCISCENSTEPEEYYSKYYGLWELTKTTGGFGGGTRYPEEGESIRISYDSFYRFRLYRNDTLKVSANYTITPETSYGDKIEYTNIELFDNSYFSDKGYANFTDEQLMIWDGMVDGFSYHYKSVRK